MKSIKFMPLGGAQNVGESSYFLQLGDTNILLDAGANCGQGFHSGPNYYYLLSAQCLESFKQINQIFVSHAHWDHIGYLPEVVRATGATVYMTEMTAMLAEHQLYDKEFLGISGKGHEEARRLAIRQMLDHVVKVNYLQTIDFGTYKVTFLPAGHIPGAMMMLFEYAGKKILYTGDYSTDVTALTEGCVYPEEEIDAMILCGLNAKRPCQPNQDLSVDVLYQALSKVFSYANWGKSVICHVPQLSKGVEFLKEMDVFNINHVPIYVDESIMAVVEKMEKMSVPILSQDIHVANGTRPAGTHIYVTAKKAEKVNGNYEVVNVDFSLHDDFTSTVEFIKKLNPKTCYVVHCAQQRIHIPVEIITKDSPKNEENNPLRERERILAGLKYTNKLQSTLETVLRKDPENRTEVIFPTEGILYRVNKMY